MITTLEPPAGPSTLLGEIRDFLESLARELPRAFASEARRSPVKTGAARGRIPYRGAELEVRYERCADGAGAALAETEDGLLISRPAGDRTLSRGLLEGWYREKAARVFAQRAAVLSRAIGVRHNRIAIKDQRTLWGSCSRAGNLNFNWRVIMAPPEVLDYLVVHELAHLLEMNHSPRFWGHVARVCPDHKERRRWLRQNGRRLYGRPRGRA